MQTVETLNEGLKRGYTLTIPASDIAALVDKELKTIAPQIRMPGFRPGKVPPNLVRKMHGAAIEQDAVGKAVQEGVQAVIKDKGLRPAMQPAVEMSEDWEAGKDIELKIDVEVLPEIKDIAIDGLKLDRLTVEPGEEAVDAAVARLADQQKSFEPAPKSHKAKMGDAVVIDFTGKVDGEEFAGGKGEGMTVELGAGQLIPGFEEQLVGVKANDEKTLEVGFPDDYQVEHLKGRTATFDVVVAEVRTAKPAAKPDDEFAKSLGLDSLDRLRDIFRGQQAQELNALTRTHMKRQLLDALAARHDFPVPPSMVEAEFDQIWKQLEHEAGHEPDPEAALKEMEDEREDYKRIAERRVRLGLLLSEIGQRNGVQISSQEMNQLVTQAAQQYSPKERERFVEYVRNEPMAAAQLRAPLYEDKVVDHLFGTAEISDRVATREELEAAIESEEGAHIHGPDCDHDHDHEQGAAKKKPVKKAATAKKPAAAKASASAKASAKDAAADKTAAEKKPVEKKPAARKPAAKKPATGAKG
ncbi:MAG: trigger factor [Sphingomonadaceae bacterium]|nr:trigger factor [Sphingomonadaceae bacterium]